MYNEKLLQTVPFLCGSEQAEGLLKIWPIEKNSKIVAPCHYICSVAMCSEIGSSLSSNNNLFSYVNMEGDTVVFIDQGV